MAAVLLVLLLLGCQPSRNVFSVLERLPSTPPLSSPQKWAVVNTVALKLSAQPTTQARIIVLVPRGELLPLLQLRLLPNGEWAQVRYQAGTPSEREGWLPASGLVILPNRIEAEATSRRLSVAPSLDR